MLVQLYQRSPFPGTTLAACTALIFLIHELFGCTFLTVRSSSLE